MTQRDDPADNNASANLPSRLFSGSSAIPPLARIIIGASEFLH
jgi:hypothetical protein